MTDQTKRKIEEIIQEERSDADRKYPLFSSLHEGESVMREEIEEVSEVLDEIMEAHNWIWKAVRANKSETVKSAAKTIAKLSRELIAESVQVAAVAGKIVDGIEREEPEVDWSKIPTDTKIYVKDNIYDNWTKRYFARYEKGKIYAWNSGCTSWSAYGEDDASPWKYAKLAEEENL